MTTPGTPSAGGLTDPRNVFGDDAVEDATPLPAKVPGKRGVKSNTHQAPFISQNEVHRITGFDPKTIRSWKAKGCDAFDEKGKVNLGRLLEWKERYGYAEGSKTERLHAASTGAMTKPEIELEMAFLDLMKKMREEGRELGEWVLLEAVEANHERMLGRIKGLLRMIPEVVDAELEIAMSAGKPSSSKRKQIISVAVEEVCAICTMDRILTGDPEDTEDADLENRLAEAMGDL